MTPSAILSRAADLIRDAGKKAGSEHDCRKESCGGLGDYYGPCGGCCSCRSGCVWDGPGEVVKGGWLDLMRPSVASVLADWLEAEKSCLTGLDVAKETLPKILNGVAGKSVVDEKDVTVIIDTSGPALAFARHVIAVLGLQEEVSDGS